MAFVAEDGTGLANANSYADVAFADAYFTDRGNTVWEALDEDVKKAKLISATDYIDMVFGRLFKSVPLTETQALAFPREAYDGIPVNVKKAASEYALRAASAPLAPDLAVDPSGYQISRKFEKVGPIEERTDFAIIGPGASRNLLTPYPAADMLLRPFLRAAGGTVIRN